MLRCSMPLFMLLFACGGASSPASSPAAKAPEAPTASPAAARPAAKAPEAPDRDYQEALRCDEECETTEEGDADTVEAYCREQCGLPPREP
ncbi:MAG: hypothetical protein IPL61_39205 [Myxococcales bacterium]|nr:hypothetical protein [Myxococcales bacterium]